MPELTDQAPNAPAPAAPASPPDWPCPYCGPGQPVATAECAECQGTGFLITDPRAQALIDFLQRHARRFMHPAISPAGAQDLPNTGPTLSSERTAA